MRNVTLGNRDPEGNLANLLRRNGIIPTPQRMKIVETLLARPQHLSAEQVLEQVNCGPMRVAKATVYNTLNLLVARGLARQVMVEPGRVFYDSNPGVHYHVFNEDTGQLIDFPTDAVRIAGWPQLPPDTALASVDLVIRVRNHRHG